MRLFFLYSWLLIIRSTSLQAQQREGMDSIQVRVLDCLDTNPEAIPALDQLLTKRFGNDKFYPGYHYRILGLYHDAKSNFDSSQFYLMKAMESSVQCNDEELLSNIYIDIGILFIRTANYLNAERYIQKAIEVTQKLGNQKRLAAAYNNMGIINRKQKKYDTAIAYYQKSHDIKMKLKDVNGALRVANNLGALYLEKGVPQRAVIYFQNIVNTRKKLGQNLALSYEEYSNLAGSYSRMKNFIQAEKYLDTTQKILQENWSREKALNIQRLRIGIEEEKENFKEAYYGLMAYQQMKDSLMSNETMAETNALLEKYAAIKRERDNQILATKLKTQTLLKRNYLLASLGLSGILFTLGLLLYQRNKKNKQLHERNEEIKKINSLLAEINQEKNELISIVSHDLSTPFAHIKLWNSVLEQEVNGEESSKAVIRIKQAIQTGETMIKHILDVDRIFAKEEHALILESINIVPLLDQVMAQYEKPAKDKNITIHKNIPPNEIGWITDKNYFIRIVDNLLSNAIKYTHPGKAIQVALDKTGNNYSLSVQDEGIGLKQEDIKNIFSKYSGIKNNPTGNEGSHGLGMHIVKKLADELRLSIEVNSEPMKGTRITLFYQNNLNTVNR